MVLQAHHTKLKAMSVQFLSSRGERDDGDYEDNNKESETDEIPF